MTRAQKIEEALRGLLECVEWQSEAKVYVIRGQHFYAAARAALAAPDTGGGRTVKGEAPRCECEHAEIRHGSISCHGNPMCGCRGYKPAPSPGTESGEGRCQECGGQPELYFTNHSKRCDSCGGTGSGEGLAGEYADEHPVVEDGGTGRSTEGDK